MTVTLPVSRKRRLMDALLRLTKGHWTPCIIWTLGGAGPLRFGAIRRQVAGVSAKVLTDLLNANARRWQADGETRAGETDCATLR